MKLNVPYFKQEKNTTCGVVCVRMVFSFYGKEVSEFELEDACETGWLGNTCSELVRCIEGFEFKAEEVEKIDLEYLQKELEKNRPMIAPY